MPISIRFRVRPKTTLLQIRFSVNGQEDGGFSRLPDGSTLSVDGLSWNQKRQQVDGRSIEATRLNGRIASVKSILIAVFNRQAAIGIMPTCETIKTEYMTGKPIEQVTPSVQGWTLIKSYKAYIVHVRSLGVRAGSTLDKWDYGLTYLTKFLEATASCDKLAESVTIPWAKKYHAWLMKTGPMAADSATRYVQKLSNSLDHLVGEGDLKSNPLYEMSLPRDKTKEVYFLEPEHLEKFWALNLPAHKGGVSCWWMGVIFLTGLDYADAVRYVQDRYKYERVTPYGKKIVIRRNKPPKAECHIPVLPELEALLLHHPAGEPPQDWEINRDMYAVETLIGFEQRLTCKIGRKTAGAIFLWKGFRLESVSRILGHSSVSVTERYYVKITGTLVDKDMGRLNGHSEK